MKLVNESNVDEPNMNQVVIIDLSTATLVGSATLQCLVHQG
jgi:anti-anti-sigma regulatory factor